MAEDCGALLDVDITFEDELAVDGADEEVDGGAELRDEEAAALVADEAELAEAPVPTGAFCRRRRALSTSTADATDKMARRSSTIRVIVRLEYMVVDVCFVRCGQKRELMKQRDGNAVRHSPPLKVTSKSVVVKI